MPSPALALSPFTALSVVGAFAVGEPEACRLADLAARNASNDRIQRWAVESSAALAADHAECECCGSSVAFASTVVRGLDRLCRDCATDEDEAAALDWRAERVPAWARPAEGEGLRAGAAGLLGLCEECDEDLGADDRCATCGGSS